MKMPFGLAITLFFLAFSITGFCNNFFSIKDSTKIKEANKLKMIRLQKMLDSVKIGNVAPEFKFISVAGDSVKLSSYHGKVVVLDFWATWCPPCIAQFPFYDKLKEKFAGKNVVFLSISIDDSKSRWEKYMKKHIHSGIQLWSGPVIPAYYYTLMDFETLEKVDPINANSSEAKKTFHSGVTIFDGVPGNFAIIGGDGKIAGNWLLPSQEHIMEDMINELLTMMQN